MPIKKMTKIQIVAYLEEENKKKEDQLFICGKRLNTLEKEHTSLKNKHEQYCRMQKNIRDDLDSKLTKIKNAIETITAIRFPEINIQDIHDFMGKKDTDEIRFLWHLYHIANY